MPQPTVPLAWERPIDDGQVNQLAHPERAAWSTCLCQLIDANYDLFIGADDIRIVIPDFRALDRDQRVTRLGELYARVAEYETDWKPAHTEPDVGGGTAPEDLATGLYQLNVHDQATYHTGTEYTADELKDPLNNIRAAMGIAVYLLQKNRKVTCIKGTDETIFFETLLFDAQELSVHKILRDVWFFDVGNA
jgi:hypothetical protein